MNDPFETPPELEDIEAMLAATHPLETDIDGEETRIAQDRIVFESGKVVGRQTSQAIWWKVATAIMSSVASVLLFMQIGALFTEQQSIEHTVSTNLETKKSTERENSNRDAVAGTPKRPSSLAGIEFSNRRPATGWNTDPEDDQAYCAFLNQRYETVKRSTLNQKKDPS